MCYNKTMMELFLLLCFIKTLYFGFKCCLSNKQSYVYYFLKNGSILNKKVGEMFRKYKIKSRPIKAFSESVL